MTKVVEHPSKVLAERLADALDQALSYPTTIVDYRGSNCPPAPFGETLQYSDVLLRADGRYLVAQPPASLRGHVERVGGVPVTIDDRDAVEDNPGLERSVVARSKHAEASRTLR